MGLGLGRFPNAARGRKQKVAHVYNLGKVPEFLGEQCLIVYTTEQHARTAHMLRRKTLSHDHPSPARGRGDV
jgi:hypothetical protein